MCAQLFFGCIHFKKEKSNAFDVGPGTGHVKQPVKHRSAFPKVIGYSHMRHNEVKPRRTDYAEGSIHLMSNEPCSLLATS